VNEEFCTQDIKRLTIYLFEEWQLWVFIIKNNLFKDEGVGHISRAKNIRNLKSFQNVLVMLQLQNK